MDNDIFSILTGMWYVMYYNKDQKWECFAKYVNLNEKTVEL